MITIKKIYCFDFDNTLFSRKNHKFHTQTIKLIDELSKNDDYILVVATGRRPSEKVYFSDVMEYFDYQIFLNGSICYHGDATIYRKEIDRTNLKKIIDKADQIHIPLGITSEYYEYVLNASEEAKKRWTLPQGYVEIDKTFDFNGVSIFQLWILEEDRKKVDDFIAEFPHFKTFYWTEGGAHFVSDQVSKAVPLSLIKEKYNDYLLVTIGDGHNDIEMIELSDIGIAMGNTKSEELKNKANLIANHIDEDTMYDFFKKSNLL